MNKIEIKDLYLVFGPEKQKAFRMLKERKSKNEILKATNCTWFVKETASGSIIPFMMNI